MGNLSFKLKKFFQNKNTVTILGVVLGVLVIYFGYNYTVNQAIRPIDVPFAKVPIKPREQITMDKIGITKVPPAMIKGKAILDVNLIVGKWSNYDYHIPYGSMFYEDALVAKKELPDSIIKDITPGFTAFNLSVDINSTYGNSIFPENYIDIYFKALNSEGKIIYGKLVQDIQILAVKDNSGQHVFENSDEARTPSIMLFSVPEDIHLLLRKALYLRNVKEISAELIPIPTNSNVSDNSTPVISNQELKTFIEINTGLISEDELPDVTPEE
jgi:Flp pilus assembly protein CpaB